MMNEKKSYKVQIFEESYVLTSNGSESFILKAVEMVDSCMKEISQQNAIVDVKKIAILTALRIADQLLQNEHCYNKNEQRIMALKNYIEQESLL